MEAGSFSKRPIWSAFIGWKRQARQMGNLFCYFGNFLCEMILRPDLPSCDCVYHSWIATVGLAGCPSRHCSISAWSVWELTHTFEDLSCQRSPALVLSEKWWCEGVYGDTCSFGSLVYHGLFLFVAVFCFCFFFALRTLQRMFFLIFQSKWPVFPKMSSLPSDKHMWIISCISENQSPGGRRILLQDFLTIPPQSQWTIVSLDLIRFIHAARQRTRCQDLIKRMYATNPIRIRSESQSWNSAEDYSSCYRGENSYLFFFLLL